MNACLRDLQLILSLKALKCPWHLMSRISWLLKCGLVSLALVYTGIISRRCYLHIALVLLNLPQFQLNSPGILLRRAHPRDFHLCWGSCIQHGYLMCHMAALRTPRLLLQSSRGQQV